MYSNVAKEEIGSLAQLEEQINRVNVLNKIGAKALDAFAENSNSISFKARQIVNDVKVWEVAKQNISLMIEEMSKASRSYNPPPFLYDVLMQKENNPKAIAQCMDYLAYADTYLASHPSTDYADQIQRTIEKQIRQIVNISEEHVKRSFFRALHKLPNQSSDPSVKRYVVRNPGALHGIDLIIQRLGESFGQSSVIHNDVYAMIQSKLRSAIEGRLSRAYREENGAVFMPASSGMPHMPKYYQPKDHPLLKISLIARESVREVSHCVYKYIIKPLSEVYTIVEMPSQLAAVAFDIIMDHAIEAIHFDKTVFRDANKMFINSHGRGIELYHEKRYLRDIIFIGLDIIEDLWQWKNLAVSLPGEHDSFIDYVDIELKRYLEAVRDLLEGYAACKGTLDKERLMFGLKNFPNLDWIPSMDCTTHEITSNLFNFQKILLSFYYGSLKLTLHGSLRSLSNDDTVVLKVQNYLIQILIGTLHELQVIMDVALELDKQQENGYGALGVEVNNIRKRTRISPQIFLLGNIGFLVGSYKREACFEKRLMPATEDTTLTTGCESLNGVSTSTRLPISKDILDVLEDEKERCIDEFQFSWEKCFPDVCSSPELRSLSSDPNEPFSKSQRMALKQWNRSVASSLKEQLETCRVGTLVSLSLRARLIKIAERTVRNNFLAFENILRGRVWSKRPRKWTLYTVEEWVQRIRNML